jgi:hypothetical protein
LLHRNRASTPQTAAQVRQDAVENRRFQQQHVCCRLLEECGRNCGDYAEGRQFAACVALSVCCTLRAQEGAACKCDKPPRDAHLRRLNI